MSTPPPAGPWDRSGPAPHGDGYGPSSYSPIPGPPDPIDPRDPFGRPRPAPGAPDPGQGWAPAGEPPPMTYPPAPQQPAPQQPASWQPGPQQPPLLPRPAPSRRRTGLVVGLIVGGVVLMLIAVAAVFVLPRLTRTVGAPAHQGEVPAECRTSASVMAGVGTPNLAPPNVDEGGPGIERVSCGWRPAESERTRVRSTTVTFNRYTTDYPTDPLEAARANFGDYPGRPVDGIGDAAVIIEDEDDSSAYRSAEVRVIKGTTVFSVLYGGYDTALFGSTPMPDGAAAAGAQAVARELATNLG